MAVEMAAGKLRNLMTLADENGRFKMMAIDQRGSLQSALAKVLSRDPGAVTYDDMARCKRVITASLAPYATAVLTDPIFGYPNSVMDLLGSVGLLLAYEDSGYDKAGPDGKERRSRLIPGWSVEKARRAGANAIKILLYYHPDASEETNRHQQGLVRRVGEECARHQLPFLLELLAYPLEEESTDTPAYARRKPDLVARSAAEFSRPEYQVDLLKLEFPADLKHCYEYCRKVFDSREREPVYDLAQVRDACRRLDEASAVPWVILSAGVGIAEFVVNVELATQAGCSGFLCGRAIWQEAVQRYPDLDEMEEYLLEDGAINFMRCNAAGEKALPWFDHRPYGGIENVAVADRSPEWYQRF